MPTKQFLNMYPTSATLDARKNTHAIVQNKNTTKTDLHLSHPEKMNMAGRKLEKKMGH